ncbi:hypothetical protein C1N81_35105 [Streptomyces sp. SGAir0957]
MRGRLSVGGTTVGGMTRLIVEDRVERPAAEVLHTIVRPEALSAFFETVTEQPMGDGAEGAARRRGSDTELVG